jgi:putative ABC transport system permease protein
MLFDLKYAFRQILKRPGFTLVAVATLAISLGANTAIFSLVDAVLLKPPGYTDPDRIVRVLEAPPSGGRNSISVLNFLDWQKQNTVFDYLAASAGGTLALSGTEEPARLPGDRVSAHYFDILGVHPLWGRTFADGEDQAGKDHVVVLSNALWQSRFGADPSIVGRTLNLDGETYTVIGVLPPGTPLERGRARIWTPLTFTPANLTRNFHWLGAIARLKPGVTLEQARARMDAIGQRMAHDYPDSNKGWSVGVDLLADTVASAGLKQSLYVLFGAVAMVLLIACANLANLSLMRAVGREREIGIRIALGAGRGALLRQFLTESVVLSLIGGGLGLAVAQLVVSGVKSTMPAMADVGLDGRVLLFSFLLALLTGAVIGLFPALQASRGSVTNSLKQGGAASTGGSRSRIRSALVVAEVALAFVLLTGAGLLIRSLDQLGRVDPGFESANVLTFSMPVASQRLPDPAALNSFLREVRTRLEALPGVTDVALTSALPLRGWGYGSPFQIVGQKTIDPAHRNPCFFKMVSSSYFHTIGMHLLQGRFLADTDVRGRLPVTVINQTMVKKYFPGENPIGKQILVREIVPGKAALGEEIPWQVVGVVADEQLGSPDNPNTKDSAGMYVSLEQNPQYDLGVAVRSSIDTGLLREAVKKAVHGISRDQVVDNFKTLDVIRTESLGDDRLRVELLGGFAGVSLLLSAIGIYGVISYSVTQRTRELGIRSALGAGRGDLLKLVLGQGMNLTAIGLLLGMGGALALMRLLTSLLFGVSGHDPATMAVVAAALGLVALIACALPARRAAQADPMVALRAE